MKRIRQSITATGKCIIEVLDLGNHMTYNEVLKAVKMADRNSTVRSINLDFSKIYNYSFPNCIVPITGMVDYFKKVKESLPVAITSVKNKYLINTKLDHPTVITKSEISKNDESIFNRVWKFTNPSETKLIADQLYRDVSQKIECESGVINAMSWCVNEIMDNTLRHSKTNVGFFMCQNHNHTKHLVFTIYDYGIGLYNSLYPSKYKPKSDIHAIELAMTKNVTRDTKEGQGFGLWGLHQIIKLNDGILNITSGSASYMMKNTQAKRNQYFDSVSYLSPSNGAVLIDFQLNYQNKINLNEVLVGGQYEAFQELLEEIEDINGCLVFEIQDKSEGTGTRLAGAKVRNLIINIFKDTQQWILIDFKNVKYLTSSYADELLGKLIEQIGENVFVKRFRIKNLNEDLQDIVSYAMNERLKKNQSA